MSDVSSDNTGRSRRPVQNELTTPTVSARMLPDEVRMMFALAFRQHGLLLSARAELTPTMFSPISESGQWLFLTVLYSYYDRYNSIPPVTVFELECRRVAAEQAALGRPLTGYEWAIDTARMAETEVIGEVVTTQPQYGLDLLSRFLRERLVSDALAAMARQTPGHLAYANMGGIIEQLSSLNTRAEAVRGNAMFSVVPTADELQTFDMPRVIRTGVPFIDTDVLNGLGCEAGKVYGLLGPYGSFKTGLGVQIVTSCAKLQLASPDPGLCVYFVYEGGRREIQIRAMAQLAEMPKQTIEEFYRTRGDLSVFSTSDRLRDYEVSRYARQDNQTPAELRFGEAERYYRATELARFLYVADMSGSNGNETAGSGYVSEIVQYLDRLSRASGLPIRMVVVDYVKRMCVRHLQAKGLSTTDRLREFVSPVPDTIRRMVAEKFGCAVWLLQQLNAEANKRAPGAAQHHSDAAESKDFGENLWYCLTLSNPDRANNNTLQLAVTKSRDSAAPPSGMVVRIDGNSFSLVRDPDHVIGSNGRIVQTGFHNRFVDGGAAPPAGPTQTQPEDPEAHPARENSAGLD